MGEYLAPGVYVEEVDTGSKPIEGVSTSTAGVVGVTERGPANVPMLVTSMGEFRRLYGDHLNPSLYFGSGAPADHAMHYLPHAVEGFFTNGGKRLFVTRVLDTSVATAASRNLVAPDVATPLTTHLIRGAGQSDTAVVLTDDPGFIAGNTVQIGDLAEAEFNDVVSVAAAPSVGLNFPLSRGHASPEAVQVINLAPVGPGTTLMNAAQGGQNSITVTSAAGIVQGQILRIGAALAADEEFAVVAALPVGTTVQLVDALLFNHAASAPVQPASAAGVAANKRALSASFGPVAGDSTVFTQTGAGAFAAGDVVAVFTTVPSADFNTTTSPPDAEIRRVSQLTRLALTQSAYADYPRGSRIERLTLNGAIPVFDLVDDVVTGDTVVTVSDRSALSPGDILVVGLGADLELVEVAQLLPPTVGGNNPGRVQLRNGFRRAHPGGGGGIGTVTRRQVTAVTNSTSLAIAAATGDMQLVTAGISGLANSDILRVITTNGGHFYHALTAAGATTTLTPVAMNLNTPLASAKSASSGVYGRTPMMEVRALDAGQWGNRLHVAMELQREPLLSTAMRGAPLPGGTFRLNSASGIETGTELEFSSGTGLTARVKVLSVNPGNNYLITLEPTTPVPMWAGAGTAVRTIEYRMVVELQRQNDPANPARSNSAIAREVFPALSLDPRHSRYFQRVIGSTWNMTNPSTTHDDAGQPLRVSDRRSEGESDYIRVRDLSPGNGLRPGPVAAYEIRPGATPRLILFALTNGNDQLGAVTDPIYIGTDNVDPELRTGLFTLRNIEEISIVAAPGRTSPAIQNALINHCEAMRYRFAVLDANPPPRDAMGDVQLQRQQFDTKYAALYHPWLVIPDPYPASAGVVPDYPIPPSGHMLGIYARTDIERGVHKAPANEVVRGITGLQRIINKEQHDILNPYPVNINVIRDFRNNSRGIRVYGGRCITSDSDWKYVNVRRLMIYIESSIDRGLQWVVFEPNAEPLWARVRRSISNFLTLVWRNGGLEGTKPEEAFFVKCDRTTMTQTDIDSGRLICEIGVAPVKPAEFVIIRIGLWTAHSED